MDSAVSSESSSYEIMRLDDGIEISKKSSDAALGDADHRKCANLFRWIHAHLQVSENRTKDLLLSHENGSNEAALPVAERSNSFRRQPQGFKFLDLPAELRLKIYDSTHSTRWIWITTRVRNYGSITPHKGLARACWQTYRESRDSFFSSSTFAVDLREAALSIEPSCDPNGTVIGSKIDPYQNLTSWLNQIGDGNAGRIQKLVFYHRLFRLFLRIEKRDISLEFKGAEGSFSAFEEDQERERLQMIVDGMRGNGDSLRLGVAELAAVGAAVEHCVIDFERKLKMMS